MSMAYFVWSRVHGARRVRFFSDKPEPALLRQVNCSAESCSLTPPKCVLKLRKNPYPKALANYHKHPPDDLGDHGEDIIDQIFAQALSGDAAALKFFEVAPAHLDGRLDEVFDSDKRKLKQALELHCP